MTEMALTAEHFVIIGRGRLIADVSGDELQAMASEQSVFVRTPDGPHLRRLLAADGVEVRNETGVDDGYTITGVDGDSIGRRAAANGLVLLELTPRRSSLEATFMALTHDSVEYQSHKTNLISTGKAA